MMSRRAGRSPSGIVRWARRIAVMAGAGLAIAGPAGAKTVAPEQAPPAWLRYAELATTSVTQWLQADDDAALRLRTHLDTRRAAPDQPSAPLLLKLWIDRHGKITRIAHAPLADAASDGDLQSVIVGRTLAAKPPARMLLPLRIVVTLDAAAPDGEAQAPESDPRPSI